MNESIWAAPSKEGSNYFTRPGAWKCSSCGRLNLHGRTDCMECSKSRTGTPRNSSPTRTNAQPNLIALEAIDGKIVSGYNPHANSSLPLSSSVSEDPPRPKPGKMLADSLWAPRKIKARGKRADASQVWTKRSYRDYDRYQSNIGVDPTNPTVSPSLAPDLGLPYEVQHFILAMIQRIIEEGCYDFANRWIPTTLNERNWRCAEAVELSAWRDFLPTALPPNAVFILPQCSLLQGLKDAVRIRNAAVHRHLCDNFEIRKMARQAQDLMTMFRDVTRQAKFQRLWEELNDWDKSSNNEPQAAKRKLEQALLEINERPMDDMDWTPNAVSLQEITSHVQCSQDAVEYGDEMEID